MSYKINYARARALSSSGRGEIRNSLRECLYAAGRGKAKVKMNGGRLEERTGDDEWGAD